MRVPTPRTRHDVNVAILEKARELLAPLPAELAPLVAVETDPARIKVLIDRATGPVIDELFAFERVLLEQLAATEH